MARRYHEIKGLAEFTAKTIVPNEEQMLIYAQRPDATACASLELWKGAERSDYGDRSAVYGGICR